MWRSLAETTPFRLRSVALREDVASGTSMKCEVTSLPDRDAGMQKVSSYVVKKKYL